MKELESIVSDNSNLFEVLEYRVARQPDALLYTFLDNHGNIKEQYTYQQFAERVTLLARAFRYAFPIADKGALVLLAYQPGLEMIAALFACNKAGFIGVPTAPLTRTDFPVWQYRVGHILHDTGIRHIALCTETDTILRQHQHQHPELIGHSACDDDTRTFMEQLAGLKQLITSTIFADSTDIRLSGEGEPITHTPPDTFFIQYTSGSTSEPKGVMVSHTNLLANCAAVVDHPKPIAVSWLPQHHDMGLIGYYIDIMVSGGCTYGFAPAAFIRRPLLWFETITRYRATATSIPAFALELCLHERRVSHEAFAQLDLSTLRFLMVAAEPVRPDIFAAFLEKFSCCGLAKQSLFVAYGLAEFTLAVSSYGRRALTLDARSLADGCVVPVHTGIQQKTGQTHRSAPTGVAGRGEPVCSLEFSGISGETERTLALMSCGKPLGNTALRIMHAESGQPVSDGETGEIWLAGDSVTQGYYHNPVLTTQTFCNTLNGQQYLRTGDVGFLHEGELFICGRLKDMLIVHGRNIYPQDIETLLQNSCDQVRRNAVVAFQASADNSIIVVAELQRKTKIPDTGKLLLQLRETLQIPLTKLVFLAPKSIPKTSSGKVRRSKTRTLYENSELLIIAETDQQVVISGLDYLRERYQLSGEEDYTLFEAGVDSLDLIILLHWLQEQFEGQEGVLAIKPAIKIESRLFGIISIRQLFGFAELMQQSPQLAMQQSMQWLEQAYLARREDEKRQMLVDRVYSVCPSAPLRARPGDMLQHGGTSLSDVTPRLGGRPRGLSGAEARLVGHPLDKGRLGGDVSNCLQQSQTKAESHYSKTLITGATGFLGVFLLEKLLTLTSDKLYVLVRGNNMQHAAERLEKAFCDTLDLKGVSKAYQQRVIVICGDLEQADLGLASEQWNDLSDTIDTVYHNGALVNYLLDYPRMRASNVEGTRRILDFALSGKPKVVNYISTTFIFGWATKSVLSESDNNTDMELLDFGYSQSKWVAEQLVLSAMEQGLSARIFRPALITPALDGAGGELDITLRLLAFMLKYGIAVDTQNQVSFMPVDTCANNMVAIAQQTDSLNRTFHVTRDQHETLPQITALLSRKTGAQFTYYPLQDFVPEVVKRCTPDDPLYPLLDFLLGSVDNISAMEYKQYSNRHYQQARDGSENGRQDAKPEQVVEGIITFLGKRDLLKCRAG